MNIKDFNKLRTDLFCQYCNKSCKNLNSLKQHEVRCKNNPNKVRNTLEGHKLWNKGLTKETDGRIRRNGESISKAMSIRQTGVPLSEKHRKAISAGLRKADLSNVKRHSYGKAGYYNGIYLHSTYELAYYIYNIDHNINIERCRVSFKYMYENNIHRYTPDFYLPDNDLYIELKGYETDKDRAKYTALDNLQVLYYDDIKHMIEYVKNTYNVEDVSILYVAQ